MITALRRILRWEDVLVAIVAFAVLPVVDAILGRGAGGDTAANADQPPIVGILALVAILGVIACVLTRGPDEPEPLADGQLTLQGWARFPLAAGVGIVAIDALPAIGMDGDAFAGLTFLAVFASALGHRWLPVVQVPTRRLLVAPMTVVAAGAFNRIMGSSLGDLVGGTLAGRQDPTVAAFLPLIVAAAGMLYTMLVIAPRAIADPEASGTAWVVRFLVLLVSAAAGNLIAGAIT